MIWRKTRSHPVRFHQPSQYFFHANNMRGFFLVNRFGNFSIDFSLKSGESIVGKIEWWFFCQTQCADNLSLGKKKFDEIDPESDYLHCYNVNLRGHCLLMLTHNDESEQLVLMIVFVVLLYFSLQSFFFC